MMLSPGTKNFPIIMIGLHNYCGKTTLTQLLAILTKAQMLVGNDSGSMHLMAALQRPQIAVFGSTSPTWTGPINANASVAEQKILDMLTLFFKNVPFWSL